MFPYEFAYPYVLLSLLILPLLILWYIYRYNKERPKLKLSNTAGFKDSKTPFKAYVFQSLIGLRLLGLACFLVALARPQLPMSEEQIETEGIDIVIALDVSASMLAQDFRPNRLEASKRVATDFIDARKNDRIGMVIFAGEAFTQCPITIDHQVLTGLMKDIKVGVLEGGTAIGSGLGTAINRLKDSKSVSKVVILLTDGVNNAGAADPRTIADVAVNYGIRVHTIGVGSTAMAKSPVAIDANGRYIYDMMKVEIDEELLTEIAGKTGGNYYRATGNEQLRAIYEEIDALEKSKISVSSLPKRMEKFFWFIVAGLICLTLEMCLRYTYVRTIT